MCLIQLPTSSSVPFLQRRHGPYCAKPTWIWSGWPGQGLAKCIWSESKSVCRDQQVQFLVGCNWPATSSHFQTLLCSSADIQDHTVWNQPRSSLVLADCVRFSPNVSSLEASLCATIIQPTSGKSFQANPEQMRIGSGMFNGLMLLCILQLVNAWLPLNKQWFFSPSIFCSLECNKCFHNYRFWQASMTKTAICSTLNYTFLFQIVNNFNTVKTLDTF